MHERTEPRSLQELHMVSVKKQPYLLSVRDLM